MYSLVNIPTLKTYCNKNINKIKPSSRSYLCVLFNKCRGSLAYVKSEQPIQCLTSTQICNSAKHTLSQIPLGCPSQPGQKQHCKNFQFPLWTFFVSDLYRGFHSCAFLVANVRESECQCHVWSCIYDKGSDTLLPRTSLDHNFLPSESFSIRRKICNVFVSLLKPKMYSFGLNEHTYVVAIVNQPSANEVWHMGEVVMWL